MENLYELRIGLEETSADSFGKTRWVYIWRWAKGGGWCDPSHEHGSAEEAVDCHAAGPRAQETAA